MYIKTKDNYVLRPVFQIQLKYTFVLCLKKVIM